MFARYIRPGVMCACTSRPREYPDHQQPGSKRRDGKPGHGPDWWRMGSRASSLPGDIAPGTVSEFDTEYDHA